MAESPGTDELAAALRDSSKEGGRIAIAAGRFGLIHAGTVRFLRAARAECDHLFVAVLSEMAEKGPSADSAGRAGAQHLLKPGERRRVLAAMEGVEAAGFVGQDGLPLSQWVQLAPSARWLTSGSEGDVGAACAAQLGQAGVLAESIHEGDPCTTGALLLADGGARVGATGRFFQKKSFAIGPGYPL